MEASHTSIVVKAELVVRDELVNIRLDLILSLFYTAAYTAQLQQITVCVSIILNGVSTTEGAQAAAILSLTDEQFQTLSLF